MKPTLGRIIHYNEGGYSHAALIVFVHPSVSGNLINLVYWDAEGFQHTRIGVDLSNYGAERHWHWPPRVETPEPRKATGCPHSTYSSDGVCIDCGHRFML